MADLQLHETLTRRLEVFARDQVLERADRTCELVLSLLRREGGVSASVDGNLRVGKQPLVTVGDLLNDVAQAAGLGIAVFRDEQQLVTSSPGLLREGRATLPNEVVTVCAVRGETYAGSAEMAGESILLVAKPILVHGNAVGIVACGIAASEGNSALLGLASIEADIIQLADEVQAERQRAVADFLKIIRSIAKRIHLLALNASILSAQAGEQGRGFAVVAREIGDLAERTRLSTQELEQEFLGRGKAASDLERRTGGRSGGRAA